MVYEHGVTGERVSVPLKRGSLQVVTGEARYQWKHSIPPENFAGPIRVSLTFRRQGEAGRQRVQVTSGEGRPKKKLRAAYR